MSGATVGVMVAQKIAAAGGGAAINTHMGVGGSAAALTSASVVPSGSNRHMFAVACGYASDPTAVKYGGSGGTDLSQLGTDTTLGASTANFWEVVASPDASTTVYGAYSGTSSNSVSAVFATGVNQSTPGEAVQTNTGANDGFTDSTVATITVTGVESGQVVVAGLAIQVQGGPSLSSVVTTDAGVTTVQRSDFGTLAGENQIGTAILTGVATGTSITLAATITVSATFGTISWLLGARPLVAA